MLVFNPKLKTLYRRGDNFKVNTQFITDERFNLIRHWLYTEKVDGMSVIVSPDGYWGRSANTNFNSEQQQFMQRLVVQVSQNAEAFGIDEPYVYGELAGPGIQGNPHLLDELSFFVFDVRINGFWLDWTNAVNVATKLGLVPAPVLGRGSISDGRFIVSSHPLFTETLYYTGVARSNYFEGVVARTSPYLYNNQGDRIMWKLKCSDF